MDFYSYLNTIGIVPSQQQGRAFEQYYELLMEWNQKFNLTAISSKEDVYIKHFYDSLLLLNQFDITGSLCDVGSGAGFPGIPIKIMRSDLPVTLIEPTGKRCTFLKEVIRQLNLTDIEVLNVRAEEIKERKFRFVTARAVAQLNILSELCLPLVEKEGYFIAMKGPSADEEIISGKKAIATLGGQLEETRKLELPNGQLRTLIPVRKIKDTPPGYPRNYSQIKKKPL